ncbi:cold shock domain-containing protein [Streptomyces sp. RKND-216]|uniref:cold-shock protein n=1 Tax=Streptomyces sp. RKND-216 TaxID=2562581 RepID=UPI00109D9719|nr:cold shock domain-containing protein [Streptomyces sp. RKND-216]THA26370.1 cold shock domain-containing protein [Streptomyces sp. RKND-216]
MAQGIVVRFDDAKGYGFITPDGGGEDVFVHVNELSPPGASLSCGTRVEFAVVDGERGLKAFDVHVVGAPPAGAAPPAAPTAGRGVPAGGRSVEGGEETCEVFGREEFTRIATEMLLSAGPDLTARQVLEVRRALVRFAEEHGWVD